MKYTLMPLFLAAVVVVNPVTAQETLNNTVTESPGRWVRVEATVKAPVAEVWRIFTTSKGAEEFFAGLGRELLSHLLELFDIVAGVVRMGKVAGPEKLVRAD